MSEFESLRDDIAAIAKSLDGYSSTAVHHLLEQSTQIDRLWADNAELRDELHALANRVETLTRARLAEPAVKVPVRMVIDREAFWCSCGIELPHIHKPEGIVYR